MWHASFKDGTKLNKKDHLFKEVLARNDLQLFAIDYFGIKIVLNIQTGSFTIIKRDVPLQVVTNLVDGKLIYFERKTVKVVLNTLNSISPGILQFAVIGIGNERSKKTIKILNDGSIEIG